MRPRASVGALLLDALGTLVALEPPAARLRRELAERFALHVSAAEAEQAMAAEIAFYRANLDRGRDIESLAELRAQCAEIVRAELPRSARLDGLQTAALTEALLASVHFDVYADVRPALAAARARGMRLIAVSNWDCSLHEVLARLDLTALLDGVVTSAEAGARKPSPQIFAHALRLAGVPSELALHVGDSVEEDVAGARAAGIEPLLLRRDGGPGPAGVRTIDSLRDLYS